MKQLALLLLLQLHGATAQVFRFIYDPEPSVSVSQLVDGKMLKIEQGYSLAGSVTLVQDSGYYIVVDSPSATDIAGKERMLEGFSTRGLIPGQVQLVVQTHGHPDHFGQGNFFPNARHFFGSYEYTGDTFIRTELYQNNSMPLTPNTELWSTPGHTSQDLSVVVRHIPNMGTIAVVGDLFYSENDAFNGSTWESDAWSAEIGGVNRKRIICLVDYIVPGHGKLFRVSQALRQKYGCPPPRPTTSADVIHVQDYTSAPSKHLEVASNRVYPGYEEAEEANNPMNTSETLVGAVLFPSHEEASASNERTGLLKVRGNNGANSPQFVSNYAVPLVQVTRNNVQPQPAMLVPMLESAATRFVSSLLEPQQSAAPPAPLRAQRAPSPKHEQQQQTAQPSYADMIRNAFQRLTAGLQFMTKQFNSHPRPGQAVPH